MPIKYISADSEECVIKKVFKNNFLDVIVKKQTNRKRKRITVSSEAKEILDHKLLQILSCSWIFF